MKRQIVYLLALGLLVIIGCQKELSFEGANTPAQGSLQSDASGDCLPKTVNGTYEAGTALVPATNTISVDINVTQTGTYLVTTDTVNGFYFSASGTFTALGNNTVTLRSNGTPFAADVNNFVVSFDSTFCDIQVTVLPAGAGGPAVFTLEGAPNACTGAIVNGSYATGLALTASNTVVINVNVTTIGTYNISTTYQGMVFSGTGAFINTGVQAVTLTGSGTPTTGGANTVPVTIGTSTCSFVVNVSSPAVGTLGGAPTACTPATVNGIYRVGDALTGANTVQVQINVTTGGVYSISTNTVTGFSFAGTGTVTAGPNQLIILTGTGTPATAGPQTFTVTFGTSSCTFTVDCLPALSNDYFPRTTNSNWSYEIDDDPLDSLYRTATSGTISAVSNTFNIFMQEDGVAPGLDSSGYYNRNIATGEYNEWFDAGSYLGYDNPLWASYIFLKDNVPVGTSWNSQAFDGIATLPPPTPFSIRFKYSILQKDVPVSFTTSTGTMNFTNVIVVEERFEMFSTATSSWIDMTSQIGSGKAYYARGIGLIKYEVLNTTGAVAGQQELRRYQVF